MAVEQREVRDDAGHASVGNAEPQCAGGSNDLTLKTRNSGGGTIDWGQTHRTLGLLERSPQGLEIMSTKKSVRALARYEPDHAPALVTDPMQ